MLWLFNTAALAAEPVEEIAAALKVCASGPGAALAGAQRARGEAAVTAAHVLPNLTFKAEHQRTVTGAPETETIAGLTIPLGIGGRRFLLQDAAAARRDKAFADAHATLFESAISFRHAYVEAAVDQARVEVLAEQQTALDRVSATVEKLAKGGEAAGYDLARQQTQARIHRRLLDSATAQAAGSLAQLEAWTGEPVVLAPVRLTGLAGGAAVKAMPDEPSTFVDPRVRSLEAEAQASALEARAARRRAVPDIDFFAGYRGITAGAASVHGFALTVSVPLTFLDYGQGEAAAADAEQQLAAAMAQSLRRQHASTRKSAAVQIARLEASEADLEKIAADALLLQTKATRLYAAGESTITELIDAFRTSEEARLGWVGLARQLAMARLDLMRSSGTLFDAALDKQCGPAAEAAR